MSKQPQPPLKHKHKDRQLQDRATAVSRSSSISSLSSDGGIALRPASTSGNKSGKTVVPVLGASASGKLQRGGTFSERTAAEASNVSGSNKAVVSTSRPKDSSAARGKIPVDPPKELKRKDRQDNLRCPTNKWASILVSHAASKAASFSRSSSTSVKSSSEDFRCRVGPTSDRGQGLFATKNFKPGDLVMQEKPLFFILNGETKVYRSTYGIEPKKDQHTWVADVAYTAWCKYLELNSKDRARMLTLAKCGIRQQREWYYSLAKEMTKDESVRQEFVDVVDV